jgi:hypothetical protein
LLPLRPPLLPLRSSVTPHALYDRRQALPPAHHGLNAFFTRGDGGLHIKILGLFPNTFFWYGIVVITSRSISPHPPPTFSRTLRTVHTTTVVRIRAIFSSSYFVIGIWSG